MIPIADSSPSWRDPDHPTAHDRFRQIFRDHWDTWCDLRLEDEVPPDQRAYVCKTVGRTMLCRDPSAGYARYVCPGCGYDHRGYQVHTDSFYLKGLEAAKYIGRYLGHPPLATSHITDYDGQQVTYWYTDTQTKQRVTVTCSALDFISRMVHHIPPKGMQMVRYAGLYARNIKRKIAPAVHAALEALRLQFPLFDLEPLFHTFQHLKWRERIKASFGYDPLECPRCGCIMQLAEIWDPKHGHIWMRRWLETHRMRTAARQALERIRATHPRYRQLAFDFNFET